jgi:hypothetical protein
MIAPIRTKAARGSSSSQVSAKPLRVCEARRGGDVADLGAGELGAAAVGGEVGAGEVDDEAAAGVAGTGVVAVGVSGNC